MAQSSTAAGREANLLERSAELAALAEQLKAVTSRAGGRLAFVAGEAGVGKTALVRRFAATLPATVQLMSGACDALVTPRPLAPFLHVASLIGGCFDLPGVGGMGQHYVNTGMLDATVN